MSRTATQQSTPPSTAEQADPRKLASQCFARAAEAVRQGQFDYALQLYRRCCAYMPESLMFRQALRDTVERHLGEHPPRNLCGRFWARSKIQMARLTGNDRRLLEACEQALSYNPWNKRVLLQQARVCVRLGYEQLAVWDLESILRLDPEHAKAARELADLYERQGAYEKAARLWTLLRQLNPNDAEARRRWRATQHGITEQLGQVSEQAHRDSAEADDRITLLTLPRRQPPEPADSPPPPLAELEHSVAQDPTDVERQLELARHCEENGDFERARRALHDALQISGGDLRVQEQWEDLEAGILRRRVEKARQLAELRADDEAQQQLVKAQQIELNDYELDLYRRRAQRYPNRSELKYEFALRLSRAGLLDEAIQQLTGVSNNPQLRLHATMLMADCLTSLGQRLRARQCYEQALHSPSAWDDPTLLEEARRRSAEMAQE